MAYVELYDEESWNTCTCQVCGTYWDASSDDGYICDKCDESVICPTCGACDICDFDFIDLTIYQHGYIMEKNSRIRLTFKLSVEI